MTLLGIVGAVLLATPWSPSISRPGPPQKLKRSAPEKSLDYQGPTRAMLETSVRAGPIASAAAFWAGARAVMRIRSLYHVGIGGQALVGGVGAFPLGPEGPGQEPRAAYGGVTFGINAGTHGILAVDVDVLAGGGVGCVQPVDSPEFRWQCASPFGVLEPRITGLVNLHDRARVGLSLGYRGIPKRRSPWDLKGLFVGLVVQLGRFSDDR